MKVAEIGEDTLVQYFEERRTTPVFAKTCELYDALKIHAHGEFPTKLIGERRPNEPTTVQAYRATIYEPITCNEVNRVIESLGKIRRSPDYSIKWPKEAPSYSKIAEDESLQCYCDEEYPYYSSITNWLFSVGLKSTLIDANLAILVVPLDNDTQQKTNVYRRPFPIVFHSPQVIEYKEESFAVLKSKDMPGEIDAKTGLPFESEKYYVVTDEEIVPYVKHTSGKGKSLVVTWDAIEEEIIVHGLGYLPIIRPRGKFLKTVQQYNIFQSRIWAMVPHLNEAAREYSDIQAAVVGHLFPESWEYRSQSCTRCNGSGVLPVDPSLASKDNKSKNIKPPMCPTCSGSGYTLSSSPYGKTEIRPPKTGMNETAIPTPHKGYIQKDMTMFETMEKRWERHLYRALSSLNMQFLAQVPLSISGDAKSVDRDELNNFVYNVAEDLIYIEDLLYLITCDYRYMMLYPNDKERRAMLPYIPVPQRFELLGVSDTIDQLTKMRNNNIGGSTIAAMLMDFNNRNFYDRPDISIPLNLELLLDPFPGKQEADKAAALATGKISDLDYIQSFYITQFIRRAMIEVDNFKDLDEDKQNIQLQGYAQEVLTKIKTSKVMDRQVKVNKDAIGNPINIVDTDGTVYNIAPPSTTVE